MSEATTLPFWRRLSFRIGLLVAVLHIVGDILMVPIYEYVFSAPEVPAGEEWDDRWGLLDLVKLCGLTLAYAISVGSLLGWIAARYSLPRLGAIAAQASSANGDELPGPFEESGNDEITQVARALNAMRDRVASLVSRLAERDAKRNEWVAQVSHDIRTPLTALATSLEHSAALLEQGDSSRTELLKNNTEAIIDAGRVAALSEDLLDIARLEIDHAIDKELVLPGEVVQRTLDGLAPLARRANVEFTFKVDRDLPPLEADGRLVVRALENLVTNAIHHADSSMAVTAKRCDIGIRFTVENDGPGLAGHTGEVSFAELRKTQSRADSVGLGLIVTERVAQAHGGTVAAQKLESGGVRVWFSLPAVERVSSRKMPSMNAAKFRSLALELPEAIEGAHQGHADFRVANKIFATLGPDEDWAMVKIRPDEQASFVKLEPASFQPITGAWGRRGCTRIELRSIKVARAREALRAAWRNTAPKRLIAEHE